MWRKACLWSHGLRRLWSSSQTLDALWCPLIQGTLHWQQSFVHFDKCQLLSTHSEEGRMTDTLLSLLNWWPFPSACWRASSVHTLEPWDFSRPSLLSPCHCRWLTIGRRAPDVLPSSCRHLADIDSEESSASQDMQGDRKPTASSGALGVSEVR